MKSTSVISLLHSKLTRLSGVIALNSSQLDKEIDAEERHIAFLEKTLGVIKSTKDVLRKTSEKNGLMRQSSNSRVGLHDTKQNTGYLGLMSNQLTPKNTTRTYLFPISSTNSPTRASYQAIPKKNEASSSLNFPLGNLNVKHRSSLRPETTTLVGKIRSNLENISSRVGKLNTNLEEIKGKAGPKLMDRKRFYSNEQEADDSGNFGNTSQDILKTKIKAYNVFSMNSSPMNPKIPVASPPSSAKNPHYFQFNTNLMRIPEKESANNSRLSSVADQSKITKEKKLGQGQGSNSNMVNGRSSVEMPSKEEISILLSEKEAPVISDKRIKKEEQTAQVSTYSRASLQQSLKNAVNACGLKENPSHPRSSQQGSSFLEKNNEENKPRTLLKKFGLIK